MVEENNKNHPSWPESVFQYYYFKAGLFINSHDAAIIEPKLFAW